MAAKRITPAAACEPRQGRSNGCRGSDVRRSLALRRMPRWARETDMSGVCRRRSHAATLTAYEIQPDGTSATSARCHVVGLLELSAE